jgi:hypothetical protein
MSLIPPSATDNSGGSGFNFSSIGNMVGGVASAYNDLFPPSAAAAKAEIPALQEGITAAELEKNLYGENTQLQLYAARTKGAITEGAIPAAYAANGFAGNSGTALYALKNQHTMNQLGYTTISIQGAINQQAAEVQKAGLEAQLAGAQKEAKGSGMSGILGAIGSIAGPLLGML